MSKNKPKPGSKASPTPKKPKPEKLTGIQEIMKYCGWG
jgi:hypothetical protein